MSSEPLTTLVCGGTGSQARPTVMHLLAHGHVPYVLTRNANNAADLASAGAKIVVGDMGDANCLHDACSEVDSVAFLLPAFMDLPEEGETYGRNVIDAAEGAGVGNFVWNVSGPLPADDDSPHVKLAIFRYLLASNLSWVLLEPTTYMENWLGPWTAPSVSGKGLLTYPVLADTRMGWIACDDAGALVVAALERPELAGNRFKISGVETPTGPELAVIFSAALGRDIRYQTMTPEEMGGVIDQAFGAGSGDRIAELYRKEQNDPVPAKKYHDMTPVLDALPVKMTTIVDWVKTHEGAFIEAPNVAEVTQP